MPRFKLLHTVDVSLVATPTPTPAPAEAPAVKPDPAIEFAGADQDGRFTFNVPGYDTATHAHLTALHVSLYEKPSGPAPAVAVPTDAAEIVKAALHYSVATSSPGDASTVVAPQSPVVDGTASPEGAYVAALVAEFAE